MHLLGRALVGSVRVPRLHWGWAITQTQALSFEIPIYTPRPVVFEESPSQFFNHLLREGNDPQLQYSCLENPVDGGAWWAAAHGVAKSRTQLSDFPFTFHFHALEKDMATHSSVLAWRIPGMGEPGGLLAMGSHRVGHDWSDLAAVAAQSQKWF